MLIHSVLRVFGKEYFRFLTSEEDDLYLVGRIDALRDMIDTIGFEDEASNIITKISLVVKHEGSFEAKKIEVDSWLNETYY